MSLNTLSIATDGYLKRGAKAALCIAVAGYLNFTTPVVPDTGISRASISSVPTYIDQEARRERILRDDEDILIIIKAFTHIV